MLLPRENLKTPLNKIESVPTLTDLIASRFFQAVENKSRIFHIAFIYYIPTVIEKCLGNDLFERH